MFGLHETIAMNKVFARLHPLSLRGGGEKYAADAARLQRIKNKRGTSGADGNGNQDAGANEEDPVLERPVEKT